MPPVALTIAGSDPSGGAGIQADLKTFHRFEVYGEAVITLLTVQNTQRVSRVELIEVEFVLQQLEAVMDDIPPGSVKTGALGGAALISALAAWSFPCPLVVDPVMVSKHGAALMREDAMKTMQRELMPRAALITPNLPEAAALTGRPVTTLGEMREAATAMCDCGAKAVLVKGGHLPGSPVDVLLTKGVFYEFPADRIGTRNTHGTGCTYSAAITAGLARGQDLCRLYRQRKNS